jgi:protein-L-isoaspartate(D-aspartate) O-methyltransferase
MWRNRETKAFVDWLHEHNLTRPYEERVAFYGLDLYSLYSSVKAVVSYLEGVDPDLAAVARVRNGCLTPWEADPSAYGRAALSGAYRKCEQDVAHILVEILQKQQEYALQDGEQFFDASQNARLVASAERYYPGDVLRLTGLVELARQHMFETLKQTLEFHGPESRAVVWAHNSHIGNAAATEMGRRGEYNIGQLCREHFGTASYHIGFGTNDGEVAAASDWDGPMQIMPFRPAHAQSYERLFHMTNAPGLLLPLKDGRSKELCEKLARPRLERAIGVIYRPESELASHHFEAILPRQFDEYIWIDRTCGVTPLEVAELQGMPDTYPFGL